MDMEKERDSGRIFTIAVIVVIAIIVAVSGGALHLRSIPDSGGEDSRILSNTADLDTVRRALGTAEITDASESETAEIVEALATAVIVGEETRARATREGLEGSFAELDEEMDKIVGRYDVTGMSAVAFKDGEILYSYCFGYADKENGIEVDENTKFRISSISKSISAMAIMRLVEDGRLDLDGDISDYLGFTVRSPRYPGVPITTRMILTHSSSITDNNPGYEQSEDLELLLKADSTWSSAKPGTSFYYSNFGGGIMASIIEGASGEHFVDYVQSSIIEPLGIDAAYTRDCIKDTESIAVIYRNGKISANVKTWNRISAHCRNRKLGRYYYLALGDLIISSKDLAKYAVVLAGDGTADGVRLLSRDTVEQMNSVQFDGSDVWGLSLKIAEDIFLQGRTLIGHNGSSFGMVSGMYYDREDETGVVFLTNGCDTDMEDNGEYAISNAVIRAIYAAL